MTSLAPPTALVARVERDLAASPSVVERLGRGGFAWLADSGPTIATAGVASIVPMQRAATVLRSITVDAPSDAPEQVRPIAVGAAGWGLDRPLTIPARSSIAIDGQTWSVTVRPAEAEPVAMPKIDATPRRFTVTARQDHDEWCRRVQQALDIIATTPLEKVVLAREVDITADDVFDIPTTLEVLHRDQPGCVVYAHGGLVGASPELLVERRGATVTSRPMAGTVARRASERDDDDAVAALLGSAKEGAEHEYVVDWVIERLRAVGAEPRVHGPVAQRFATVTHLVTDVVAELTGAPDAATLAVGLHPTPAVGGTPTDDAARAMGLIERFDRDAYAGPVGWVDAHGDGAFMVALRGAVLRGSTARLVAGAGIVAGSDPQAEWEETQVKLEPILRALLRP